MVENTELLNQLAKMLSWKKSKKFYADKLGISEEEVTRYILDLKSANNDESEAAQYIAEIDEKTKKVNNEKGTLESIIETSFEPKDDIELAKLHKIDLNKYKISTYWSKLKSNGKFTSSVLASLKKPNDYSIEDFIKFLETYKPADIVVKKVDDKDYSKSTVDVEISIADFHLGKQTLENETILDKKVQYLSVLKDLIEKVQKIYIINRIVFPISNDFFHTDNYQNSTTNGTVQDVLVSYDKEYEEGFDLLVTSINYLRQYCNRLDVVLVQGNHDRTKSFYLAHGLEKMFMASSNTNTVNEVVFHRKHSTTKFIVLGNTFIGYHHGNCKIDELPLLFSTNNNSSSFFGNAKYREIHTGDKHHYMAKEIKGVRIQQMPSLSGTDRWHLDNNYVNNIRAGLALIYDSTFGKIGEFESRI